MSPDVCSYHSDTDMIWRFTDTRDVPEFFVWWWWTYYMVEFFLVIAIWLGHTQRLFAVQRVRVTMDQIVAVSTITHVERRLPLSFASTNHSEHALVLPWCLSTFGLPEVAGNVNSFLTWSTFQLMTILSSQVKEVGAVLFSYLSWFNRYEHTVNSAVKCCRNCWLVIWTCVQRSGYECWFFRSVVRGEHLGRGEISSHVLGRALRGVGASRASVTSCVLHAAEVRIPNRKVCSKMLTMRFVALLFFPYFRGGPSNTLVVVKLIFSPHRSSVITQITRISVFMRWLLSGAGDAFHNPLNMCCTRPLDPPLIVQNAPNVTRTVQSLLIIDNAVVDS